MKKYLVLLALVFGLAVTATSTMAQTAPSFDNVQVSAQSTDFTSSNAVGAAVSAEKTLGSVLFVTGEADRTYVQDSQSTNFRAGLGARFALSPSLAAYGDVYALHEGLLGLKEYHSYGYGAEAGVRDQIGPVELLGGVASERAVYNAGYVTYGKVGAQLSITKHIALVADFKYHDEQQKLWNLGVAYNF